MNYYFSVLFSFFSFFLFSQEYFPKNDGVKTPDNVTVAFINATIYTTPLHKIENGKLLIKADKVVAVGKDITIPENAKVVDLKGLFIYPSFIDIYSDFGIQLPNKAKHSLINRQWDSNRDGYYWNDHIRPETKAISYFNYNKKKANELRKLGFGTVNTHVKDGIARGTSLITALNDKASNNKRIIKTDATQHFGFTKSRTSNQIYPTSLMGKLALLRQFFKDVDWYSKYNKGIQDLSIQAQHKNKLLPAIFESNDKLNDLRIAKLAKQINQKFIIKGGGNEFERIEDIKTTNTSYILPLNFPEAYDVSNPILSNKMALSDLRFWNQAPFNPSILAKNNIKFAISTTDLKKLKNFKDNLLKAIEVGLDKTKALESLTTIPAKLLNQEDKIGSIKNGAYANFLITSKPIFDKGSIIYENWVQGVKNIINNRLLINLTGEYDLVISDKKYKLFFTGMPEKPKSKVTLDSIELKSKTTYKNDWLNIVIKMSDTTKTSFIRLTGKVDKADKISGKAVFSNDAVANFYAIKVDKAKTTSDKDKKEAKKRKPKFFNITYPNMAYGFKEKPKQQNIIFRNVTVWTNEKEGILKNKDVIIKNGKIFKIIDSQKKFQVNDNYLEIDGTNKHLTSGIIDEHSHIAISNGVNEAGQNSSAEVTIQDVVKQNDINIYRNLAGGVTMAQLLHGSANPIGGRSALIKLKWGENAEEMQIKNHKFIKFALGENVKHSRSPFNSRRFPQTRMGVEQVYMDYFTRAKEYDLKKKKGKKVRYDQELEVLAEILNKKRFITCHSYIQSEITMLMRVAEKFNFKVNTFTHILEGYKVADKMKEHGVGASTFSDWWAYKYEVNDAIPYNGAILHNQGITVAYNSDDAEMSRRLNQEAAKAVKYGGVSEEEAWKFITLNPARLLHVDDKVGSIKIGKDADLVLWSDNPLSIYAKAEKTLIEGKIYFDIDRDKQLQKETKKEKNELINLMLLEKDKGLKTQKIKIKKHILYHCDTM
jgi:imidazolonepropionase-like amidohydrolase